MRRLLPLLLLAALVVGAILLTAEETVRLRPAEDNAAFPADPDAPKPDEWVRFKQKQRFGGSLQVALVRMRGPGDMRVDLLSAVHIADPAYWTVVRRLLAEAEVVLFELVKPRGITAGELLRQRRANRDKTAVSGLQERLAKWFGLEFQLEAVDYDQPHFVHADLEFGEAPDGEHPADEDAGEGGAGAPGRESQLPKSLRGLQTMLEMIGPELDRYMGDDNDPRAVKLRRHYKNLSARMLGGLGDKAAILFGEQLKRTLIDERNAIVAEKLAGLPRHSNVTIFYGAAHMRDIAERLKRMGYVRTGGRWLTAWDIPD